MTEPSRPDALPASLVDIADALGLSTALVLIEAFGGREIKLPKTPGADHPVVKALGRERADALCLLLGGQQIYVPHARARRSLGPDVARLEAQGLSRGQIARVLGISQRHVRRMANRPQDPRQSDLFD